MKRKPVSTWPTYLVAGIPREDRDRLSESAAARDVSVSDIIRGLLCQRYRLDCPQESYRYEPARDRGSMTILLRLQPKLQSALDREAARTGHSKRRIILETIASHNPKGEQ